MEMNCSINRLEESVSNLHDIYASIVILKMGGKAMPPTMCLRAKAYTATPTYE